MTTRMEKVAEHIALTVLRKASTLATPPFQPRKIHHRLRTMWPKGDSRLPMNEAISATVAAVAQSAAVPNGPSWITWVQDAWP